MTWYKKTFGAAYLDIYSHRDESEAGKVLKIIGTLISPLREKRGDDLRILDLCCGPGRYSMLLARQGHQVVGLDLSPQLLEAARDSLGRERPANGRVSLVRADMRSVPFDSAFDLVINMFTSFGYFETDQDNQSVLASIRAALAPGGLFLIDYLNRDQVIRSLVEENRSRYNGLSIVQRRKISPDRLRVEKTILVSGPDRQEKYEESVRLYGLPQMKSMLGAAGLSVSRVMGDYDGSPLADTSPRLILAGFRHA